MNYHDHMSRLKMFKASEHATDEVEKFENATPEVKKALEETTFFKGLDKTQRKHFLRGKTAFLKSQDDIIISTDNAISDFRFKYIFLSNQAHSYPMGFYRMADNNRGMGVESTGEIKYTALCLSWANECLDNAIKDFEKLWSKV